MKDADKNVSPFEILEEDDHPVPRAQTNTRVRKFAAQNVIDVSAVVALLCLSYICFDFS